MLSNEQLQRKLSGVLISFHTNNYGGAAARTIPSSCPILYGEYQALGSITLCPAPSYPAPPYTPAAFPSAMRQQSSSPMPSSAGRLLQPALFPSYSGGGKDKPFPVPCDVHSLSAMMSIPTV